MDYMNGARCATIGGGLWDSDSQGDRTDAAVVCWTCPLRQECYAEAETLRTAPVAYGAPRDEVPLLPYGVWGGFFFSGTRRPPRQVGPFTREQRTAHLRDRRRR